MRSSEQPVPSTCWQKVTPSPRQMLFGLRYSYLLVDETITNHNEALQLLNCATGDVSSVKNGGPIDGKDKRVVRKIVVYSYYGRTTNQGEYYK